ncbi:glycosyltransferase [Roseococcus pinisoli]|uniref:Glycosyltransferase n=1 Tax=Roseococcus pinisoli TaxID=2835040 RepID=A0ABS5QFD6_9PROT|nr:glycosyltransferase [Roseococcus pinisoli]MBS7812021.1 glycosyltransferase [Roseococcus pinisoli]
MDLPTGPGLMQELASRFDVPRVLHVLPSFAVGGAQVRFAALANRFQGRWRHGVLSLNGDDACAERIGTGVPLTMIPAPDLSRCTMPQRIWRIWQLLREWRPDVLVTGNWGSMEWAIANRLPPGIRHLHMEDGFGPEEAVTQLRRRVLARQWALRRSTVILPSTRLLRLAQEEWGLPPGALRYIPNGIDLARFSPDGPVAPLDIPGEGPVIGTVAALRPEKALDRLLRACALVMKSGTPFRLAIIGDGPQRPSLESLAEELGLGDRVRFVGAMPDPAAAYRAFDLFALSSSTEQMPFSILEAMASGLAVATTDVGDVRAMLAPENLGQVSALSDVAFAAALHALLVDTALRLAVGEANRARAEREFDQEAMFQSYAVLLDGREIA